MTSGNHLELGGRAARTKAEENWFGWKKERQAMLMMAQTYSAHNGNSGTVGQEHNNRDKEYLRYHVNQEHVIRDGYHRTIIHEPVEDAINRIFKDALDEYNEKKRADKKHPGREIDNYYKYLKKQADEGKKQKALKGERKAGYEAMQPCYEMIFEIGNCDTLNSRTNDFNDPERLNPELAEEVLLRAVDKMKDCFTIPELDASGNPVYDENGNLKNKSCIEIIGLYVHDDEKNKGVHVHMDYVPVAHNYKRGLKTQPGLTKALGEMGLIMDTVDDVAAERTRLMMEKYGREYHDSDYINDKGKPVKAAELSDEQRANRKLASNLVPIRNPQMKFQDLCREKLQEAMREFGIPVAELNGEKHEHLEHRQFTELKSVASEKRKTELEKERLMTDVGLITERREAMTAWASRPDSEKEFLEKIKTETKYHTPIIGKAVQIVPIPLWKQVEKIVKAAFRLDAENKELKKTISYDKVKEADSVLSERDEIIRAAKLKADEIIAGASNEASSIIGKIAANKEIVKLREELAVYKRVEENHPSFQEVLKQARIEEKRQRHMGIGLTMKSTPVH